jgi:hypothetical protein
LHLKRSGWLRHACGFSLGSLAEPERFICNEHTSRDFFA